MTEQETPGGTSNLIKATLALDSIYLSKVKVINNLAYVDSNMQKLVSMKKVALGLLIFSVVALVLNILIVLLMTYIEYRDVINVVNDNAASTQGAPGGLATAMAVKYPVAARVFGFPDASYPIAVMFMVKDPSLNQYLVQNPGEILQNMWGLTYMGGGCGIGTTAVGVPQPSILICCALEQVLGNYPAIPLCAAACNEFSSNSWESYVSDGLSAGINGAMLGGDVGGPPGALIGAIVNIGVTLGMKAYSNSVNPAPPCIS